MAEAQCEVAIVGAGPVGLLLGCLLLQQGLDVRVFERRARRSRHSRAVGVHPPGLRCLERAGVADALRAHAVHVRRAFAYGDGEPLGDVDFACLPAPYPFVLTVAQEQTEAALEQRLHTLHGEALLRDATIDGCEVGGDRATLQLRTPEGRVRSVRARFVVGCDGKRSVVRDAAGIGFEGAPYAAHFMMADMPDETQFGDAAAVFLTRAGLVESFPMPGRMRRWVVALDRIATQGDARTVAELVYARTGQRADAARATMASAFFAERYLARTFVRGPLLLAGDAAHVLSPIGGQGMNLGWLDALKLGELLPQALRQPALLDRYASERRRAARRAIRRAAAFMALATPGRVGTLTRLGVRALLSSPLHARAARLFTMHGLD